MPATTDPDQIPETPVYTISLTASGEATIDGELVQASTEDPRIAALAEIRIKAAYLGRAVRVTAKEPDGAVWPLLVDADGNVTTLDHPHPARLSQAVESGPRASSAPNWSAPLPETHQPMYGHMKNAEAAGDLVTAVIIADKLEQMLTHELGRHHPHTINVLTMRAWLTLRQQSGWRETTELLAHTVTRRHEAGAPATETVRWAHNTHAAWRTLAATEPATALTLAPDVMRALGTVQAHERAADVQRWMECQRGWN